MDVILEECLEAIRSGKTTVRDCLAKYPGQAKELEALLTVARAIETVPDVKARAAFKEELRGRIQSLPAPREGLIARVNAAMMELAKPRFRWATAVLAAALLLSATVYAADLSLPGEALYPVKRAVERIELALANDPATQARMHMALADRRLSEVEAFATTGQSQLAEQAASEYGNAVNETIAAFESRPGPESPQLAQALHDRLAGQQAHLRALAVQVSAPSQGAIQRALSLSQAASERLLTILTPEPTRQPVTQPATAPKTPAPSLTLPLQTLTPPASTPLPPAIRVPTVAPTVTVPTLPVKTPTPPASIPLPPAIPVPTIAPTVIVPILPLPGTIPLLPLPTVKPP